MISRRYKLPIKEFSSSRSISIKKGLALTIKISPNDQEFSRFGVIISSRYDKRAVYRNKIKRLIYDFIRANFNDIPSNKDFLMIVNYPKPKNQNQSQIESAIIKDIKTLIIK